ncbi:MAG: HAD family hydrolase [Lachnospiraceae bacterium]|nr:HAD family hydrolase [Lachnospiraceae bacterium]
MGNKVIFLDRDGVICKEKSYVTKLEQLEIFDYAAKAVRVFHILGYAVIVITNQSGIARGMFSEDELVKMNSKIYKEVKVDDILYCPHLPPKQGEKEREPYIIKCTCRKPNTGLIEQAVRKHDLTLNGAFFVGDRASDIETGQNAHIKTVLLESGYGSTRLEKDITPDYIFNDLMEFAEFLQEKGNAI